VQRPTLLAKIFGVYKIAYKNSILGKVVRMNLLVMENLFCGRRFTRVSYYPSRSPKLIVFQIYDLKGSMRNRRVQSTGRPNEVLLDENLVQCARYSPIAHWFRADNMIVSCAPASVLSTRAFETNHARSFVER
jgi:1-phosphatidylinositol-3-phosphate 5-kinase